VEHIIALIFFECIILWRTVFYSTVTLLLPISDIMSIVVLRVDNATGAFKHDQTNDSVATIPVVSSHGISALNHCLVSGVYKFL